MFSVVILSSNGSGQLRSAIRSVWSQLFPPNDVIVIERGESTGPGPAHWEGLARRHRQIRYVYKPGLSEASALDLGACLAEGDVVVYLDARDELLPLALEHYARCFRGPADQFCYGRAVLRVGRGQFAPPVESIQPSGDVLAALLRRRLYIHRSAFAARRGAIRSAVVPFQREGLAVFDLVLRLASRHSTTCVQEDVAIVDQSLVPAAPGFCTAQCRAVRRLLREVADRRQRLAQTGAAAFDYEAALAWRRTGRLHRALAHARRAAEAHPSSIRYWSLFNLLRSQNALTVPRTQRRPAA
jgi:hypothetical protein